MADFDVNQYSSADEEEEEIQENQQEKKKTKTHLRWTKSATFETEEGAIESLGNKWSIDYSNETEEGKKVFYRCTQVQRRGPKCSARSYLLYHADSLDTTVFKTLAEHDHDEINETTSRIGIKPEVKDIIDGLLKDGLFKPFLILEALQERNAEIPTKMQLNNYIAQNKKKRFGPAAISLGELENWCLENQAIPVDDNEPFVVNFIANDDFSSDEDDDEDEKNSGVYFALFISTKRLLEIASRATHIHADATYKLIWQGFPVLVVGTTDLNKAFHPFGLAVCKDEQTKDFEFLFESLQIGLDKIGKPRIEPSALVSDASFAIINAFSNIFTNDHDIIMCWAHMKRAVETKSAMIEDQELRAEMMDDIELLQICESAKLFDHSAKLFLKNGSKTPSVGPFILYFKSEWLEKHPGWFEGVALFVPSTNNALESTNRPLKDKVNRKRLALSVFLSNANKIVRGWSNDRDDSNATIDSNYILKKCDMYRNF